MKISVTYLTPVTEEIEVDDKFQALINCSKKEKKTTTQIQLIS